MSKRRMPERDLLAGLDDDMSTFAANPSTAEVDAQKRRLDKARHTLHQVESSLEVDARTIDKQIIAERLRKAAVAERGLKAFEKVAVSSFRDRQFSLTQTLRSEHRGHAITRLAVATGSSSTEKTLFSADKHGNIIKWRWCLEKGEWRKQHVLRAEQTVLALAVSPDGTTLLAGRSDGAILAFSCATNRLLGRLGPNEHRAAVTAIAFQPASTVAFSASRDRTVKLWAVDQLAYIDTVFGHQDDVLAVASPTADRCLSVGGRDRTVRLWKIVEESQLVFRLSESDGGSLDEVVAVSQSNKFVTASDTGRISVWSTGRKKPVFTVQAHSSPITCLVCPDATDVLISGGSDGAVKIWRIRTDDDNDSGDDIELVNELPVPGHVNGAVMVDEATVAVAVGPEGRLGRWTVDPSIKPSILVFKTQ